MCVAPRSGSSRARPRSSCATSAYGFDFVHDDACLAAARELLFAEPGYDCAAFAHDPQRRRVLGVMPADGWAAIVANAAESGERRVRNDPLLCWALVEHKDGSTSLEGLVRDPEWLDEPGGAEFPEALRGAHGFVGYMSATGSSERPVWRAA